MRGEAGIGKSYTINEIELRWALGNIYKNIDYLFHINCVEIRTAEIKTDSFKELLKKLYPDFDYDYLKSVAASVLIVVDGIDEIEGINQIESLPTSCITKCLYNVLSLNEELVSQAYVIVAG